MILKCVRQHNHFITQDNYKATCFDYRLVIFIVQTRWDPKVCIAPCDSIDKNRPEDD